MLAYDPVVLLALPIGYLCGAIPFGLILTRAFGLGDIRAIGSGNIGATNVLRTGKRGLALATLIADALKATVPILIFRLYGGESAAVAAGLGAFVGHIFPVWLRFKGGKGVATYIGVLLGLYWPAGIAFCLIWLAVAYLFRYSSLAALSASALVAIGTFTASATLSSGHPPSSLLPDMRLGIVFVVLAAFVFYTHRANLSRLIAGIEPRIGAKATTAENTPTN